MGDRTSQGRIGRRAAALTVGLLVAASGAACTGDSEDTVVAAPSALADTAEDLRSGRIELGGPSGTMIVRFDGDDVATEMEPDGETGVPEAMGTWRSVHVDGTTYMTFGDEGFVAIPDEEEEGEFSMADMGFGFRDLAGAIDELLRSSVVDQPGERTTVDGVEVTRYRATVTGRAAMEAFMEALGEDVGSTGGETRSERIDEYLTDHMTVELTGDVDDDGNLHRLTMTMDADVSEYPDCPAFSAETTEATFTITEVNDPQHIEAPPADQVRSMDEYADEMTGGFDPLDGLDGPTVSVPDDGSQVDIQPDAAADTVETATGPRTKAEVLDYLRRWAEAAGIDWRRMALPDDAQMVAWFDQFYADDLTERGPELTTSLGSYPRGYLVEVVEELDVSIDAGTLDDAALVAAYEDVRGAGVLPSTSDWGAGGAPADGDTVTSDGAEEWDEEYEMYEDDIYAGCPE